MPTPPELRPARAADAALHARVYTEVAPDEPLTAALVQEAWHEDDRAGLAERYTAYVEGQPAGLARMVLPRAPRGEPRAARLEAEFLPGQRSHYNLGHAFDLVEQRALKAGAEHLISHARESDEFLVLHLRRRGFSGRIFQWWEFDLAGQQPRLAAAGAGLDPGVRLLTLAEAGPAVARGLAEFYRRRKPGDGAAGESPLRAPGLRRDLSWVALRGDRVVAASLLTCPEGGNAWVEWADALPAEGGELPRALEARLLLSAAEAGLPRVRAEADASGERLRALEEAGWRRVPGMVQFEVSVADRLERLRIEGRLA